MSHAGGRDEGGGGGKADYNVVVAAAVRLGMDPLEDYHLLWIAEQAATAPLPPGWCAPSHAPRGRVGVGSGSCSRMSRRACACGYGATVVSRGIGEPAA